MHPLLPTVLLYLAACCLPALIVSTPSPERLFGITALMYGWMVVPMGNLAWCANLLWFLALNLALTGKHKVATWLGIIAFALGLTTYQLTGDIPGTQAYEMRDRFLQLLPGAYLWFAALAALPIGIRWRAAKTNLASSATLAGTGPPATHDAR